MNQVLLAGSLCLALAPACASPRPVPSDAAQQARPPAPTTPDPSAELAALDQELAGAGDSGSHVGRLLEKRGDLLERAGRVAEAADAFERAAGAYARSPEATNMPVIDSDRARGKAARLKGP